MRHPKNIVRYSYVVVMMIMLLPTIRHLNAQDYEDLNPLSSINWQSGPCIAKLGEQATLSIPEGYLFTDRNGALEFMELTQNPPSGEELGVIIPEKDDWFVVFEFSDSGYVKDDEKDSLDADAILSSYKEGTEKANDIRESKGWAPIHITGWEQRPYYDVVTNNLTWSMIIDSEGYKSINHSVRLLGRRGVMNADLVIDPQGLDSTIPAFNKLISTFNYNAGNRYSEYRKGDKLASYGLTALIAGGVGAAAVKSGLLAKFWKLIVAGFVVVGGAITRFFKAIFKRGVEDSPKIPEQG